jgi:hypothetical protein
MKKLLLLIHILVIFNLYANDSWVDSAGGSYTLLDSKNQNVQMVSENIKIDLYVNYYEMNIEFIFYNHGNTVELIVGFPEYSYGTGNVTNIRNFETSINNDTVEFEIVQNADRSSRIKLWYVKNVIFEANNYTVSRVHYRADYAGYGPYKGVEYLYGTGSTWKDQINRIEVEVINNTNFWLDSTFFRTEYTLQRKNDKTIEIQMNNISPGVDDTFRIRFTTFPAFELFYGTDILWRLSTEIIPNEGLVLLNNEQLRILRNSIYAYHGYAFRSLDLQNYFNGYSWYRIDNYFTENSFSANEKINLENIIREESIRN